MDNYDDNFSKETYGGVSRETPYGGVLGIDVG